MTGNACNTWSYDPDDRATSKSARFMYTEQIGYAVDEGIDFVISETNDCLGEVLSRWNRRFTTAERILNIAKSYST